ncbi:uncharacterized protein J3R85_002890 [Psidium guajava]|nr:uncharacterized protein J3R85_002890 [Psidium guajava]
MASPPTQIFPAEVMSKWERLYHLLGRGYVYIASHPGAEAKILSLFGTINTSSLEGTNLEKGYRTFPTLFLNFLEACRNTYEAVTMTRIAKARLQDRSECLESAELAVARYKKAAKSADERALWLVHEREKLVERLALLQTYFEHDSSDGVMRFKCKWLEERLEDLTVDIALKRDLIESLKFAVEHHEASVARHKEKCKLLFFKLADLESQTARRWQSINFMENQLRSFVLLIRAQFDFTFPPQ